MSYVQTVLNAVTLPAMPDMKLASSAVSPEPEQARRVELLQHQRHHHVVVGAAVELERRGRQDRQRHHARQDDDERHHHLGDRREDRRSLRRVHRSRRHGSLDDQEIGAPVAERHHEPEAHHHAEPLDAHRVGRRRAHVPPRLRPRARRQKPASVATLPRRSWIAPQPPPPTTPRNTSGRKPKTIRKNCTTSL